MVKNLAIRLVRQPVQLPLPLRERRLLNQRKKYTANLLHLFHDPICLFFFNSGIYYVIVFYFAKIVHIIAIYLFDIPVECPIARTSGPFLHPPVSPCPMYFQR